MARTGGNRLPYLVVGTGALFVWAGLNNKSVLSTLQDLIRGQKPQPGAVLIPGVAIAGTGTPDPSIDTTANGVAEAKKMLARHGWSDQWNSFNLLELGEGGYNAHAENPTTNAYGAAQALNHGNANTVSPANTYKKGPRKGQHVNMYGGFGLTDSEAQSANGGDIVMQLEWMGNYIAATYGDPNTAYMRWRSRSPHWY